MDNSHDANVLNELSNMKVWITIPAYRVKGQIERVLKAIPSWISGVVVVDDKCPDNSGDYVKSLNIRSNIHIVHHETNLGVGGAVLTGYRKCIDEGAQIIVKVDGDDQMDLRWLAPLILPIANGYADYTKGNRFSSISHVRNMPTMRLLGNSVLSFMSKVSSGYWNIFDPTNGYTAIHSLVAEELLSRNLAKRYFFESDVLYQLGSLRAVVKDIAMPAIYEDEESNLSITRVVLPFLFYHARNTVKRFIGHYLVRNFSVATLETLSGLGLLSFGTYVALEYFLTRSTPYTAASAGVVMLAALPALMGLQLLLAAVNFDILNVPREVIHPALKNLKKYKYISNTENKSKE